MSLFNLKFIYNLHVWDIKVIFLLLCLIVKEKFIISTILIFKLYFAYFELEWVTLFYIYCSHILQSGCIHLISINKLFNLCPRYNCGKRNKYLGQFIKSLNLKEISIWLTFACDRLPTFFTFLFNALPTWMKYLKSVFNWSIQ